jgi:putative ATP-dependent endonuclease of OLD family
MNPYVNEGFFANVAVLVEGESDRSCIMEVAKHIGIKFETLGISIIPVTGKANIDKPLLIFRGLGIPTYIVFDGDKNNTKKQAVIDNNKKLNRNLQTMCSLKSILDFPNTFVQSSAACFEDNLETTLRKDIGKPFDSFLKSAKKEFSCEDIKSSLVMSSIIKNAYSYGLHARTIEKIVKKIANVK